MRRLTGIVQTLYKAGQYLGPGPYGGLADPLFRMPRGEKFHQLELPALLPELLQRLPDSIRTAHSIRVITEKDTHLATRIVQRWRVLKNPISNVRIQTVRLRLVRGLRKALSQIYLTSYPCPFTGTMKRKEERWRYKEKEDKKMESLLDKTTSFFFH